MASSVSQRLAAGRAFCKAAKAASATGQWSCSIHGCRCAVRRSTAKVVCVGSQLATSFARASIKSFWVSESLAVLFAMAGLDVPLELVPGVRVQKVDAGHEHLGPLRALRRQGPEKLPVEVQGQSPGFRPP